jgi:hypothetical protein
LKRWCAQFRLRREGIPGLNPLVQEAGILSLPRRIVELTALIANNSGAKTTRKLSIFNLK